MNNWIDVAAEADLFEGAGIAVSPQNHDIAVFKLAEGVYAINNECSHGNAKLCDGFVEGNHVECPFHQALFCTRWLGSMRTCIRACQIMARQN